MIFHHKKKRPKRRRNKEESNAVQAPLWLMLLLGIQQISENAGVITGALASLLSWVLLITLTAALLWVAFRYVHNRKRRLQLDDIKEMLALTPAQFEKAVADLFHDLGYKSVSVTGRTGDLAADITCKGRKGESVVIQCKRYAPGSTVGSRDIQMFIGMVSVHHKADRGIFVTTSSYSAAAQGLAAKNRLELIDGVNLSALIQQVRPKRASRTTPDAFSQETSGRPKTET